MGRALAEGVWRERDAAVGRWRGSGLGLAEFARREGIGYAALLSWRRRCEARDDAEAGGASAASAAPLFREVAVEADACGASSSRERACDAPVEIELACGAVVRLREGASAELVRAALAALRAC